MKRFKHFVLLFLLFVVVSALLSVLIVRREVTGVTKGFAFGAPNSQTSVTTDGSYTVNYYGYPSTYRVQETFKPNGDIFNTSTYETIPFSIFYVASNFVFWMALFVALLSPITIFYRPKKMVDGSEHKAENATVDQNEVKSTDAKS